MKIITITLLILISGCFSGSKYKTEKMAEKSIDPKTKCKYEVNCSCRSPGHPIRWQYAFCMNLRGSDDFESQMTELNKCVEEHKPKNYQTLKPCDQNNFWRDKLCKIRNQYFKSQHECENTEKGIPSFVENGA